MNESVLDKRRDWNKTESFHCCLGVRSQELTVSVFLFLFGFVLITNDSKALDERKNLFLLLQK